MNNCIVLGAGRSGTSMMGQLLAKAGFHVGNQIYPPDEGNPAGYFEDAEVNLANDALLQPFYDSFTARFRRRMTGRPQLLPSQGWLLDLNPRQTQALSMPAYLRPSFVDLFSYRPFAYKDPRFSFTLPTVISLVPERTVFICIFRHPQQVVASTIKEARRHAAQRGRDVILPTSYCYRMWEAHYRCILAAYDALRLSCLFISYESLIVGKRLSPISKLVGATLDGALVRPELNRTVRLSEVEVPESTVSLFSRLEKLSS
jgi:hypothetical protein